MPTAAPGTCVTSSFREKSSNVGSDARRKGSLHMVKSTKTKRTDAGGRRHSTIKEEDNDDESEDDIPGTNVGTPVAQQTGGHMRQDAMTQLLEQSVRSHKRSAQTKSRRHSIDLSFREKPSMASSKAKPIHRSSTLEGLRASIKARQHTKSKARRRGS
eukprot:SAG31_NODE_3271_length_4477_cov_2.348561_1_plen_158_part_00